jgi:hypothetical protein
MPGPFQTINQLEFARAHRLHNDWSVILTHCAWQPRPDADLGYFEQGDIGQGPTTRKAWMRILFIAAKLHTIEPFGIRSLVPYLKRDGHEVALLEAEAPDLVAQVRASVTPHFLHLRQRAAALMVGLAP